MTYHMAIDEIQPGDEVSWDNSWLEVTETGRVDGRPYMRVVPVPGVRFTQWAIFFTKTHYVVLRNAKHE